MEKSFEMPVPSEEIDKPSSFEDLQNSLESLLSEEISVQDLVKAIEKMNTHSYQNGEACYDAGDVIAYARRKNGEQYRRGDFVAYERSTPSGAVKGSAHISDLLIDENTNEIRARFVEEDVPAIIRFHDLTGNMSEQIRHHAQVVQYEKTKKQQT